MTSTVSLFLTLSPTLCILVSLLLILNIFHILHDVKNAEICALYWKEERKVSLTDCKLKCFPPEYKPPPVYSFIQIKNDILVNNKPV